MGGVCFDCMKEVKETWQEAGDDRKRCFDCSVSFNRRKFWVNERKRRKKAKKHTLPVAEAKVCVYCSELVEYGKYVPSSAGTVWSCWNCSRSRPSLFGFGRSRL